MHASVGRKVDGNLLSSVLAAQLSARPQDAGSQDLGDLVEALGRGHEVGVEGVGHPAIGLVLIISYLPTASR
jgi:hypothetical protein